MTDEAISDLANRVSGAPGRRPDPLPASHSTPRREPTYSSAAPDSRDPSRVADALVSPGRRPGWQAATAIGKIWGEWASLGRPDPGRARASGSVRPHHRASDTAR